MEIILQILKDNRGSFISGEILAKQSGITRAAVWKQIEQLRQIGYLIESVPHKGYCLREATLGIHPFEIKENLATTVFGQKIYYQPEVDSTNSWARILGSGTAVEGTVCIAESQTRGKGRLGRSWESAFGKGLWFSMILRPRLSPAEIAVITLLTAVTMTQAIYEVSGIQLQVKWPNDLVYDNRKLVGILAELNGEMDLINYLILGIGLNVNQNPADFPPELASKAISLKMIVKQEIARVEVLKRFLEIFEDAYFRLAEGKSLSLIEYASRHSATLGKTVTISQGTGKVYRGEALGLEPDGSLKIKDENGKMIVLYSGDIIEN